MGLPVSRFVQLMRLRKAARRLASHEFRSVLDAAFDAGFDSPEAFGRAFKRAFGTAPSSFRQHPNWQVWSATSGRKRRTISGKPTSTFPWFDGRRSAAAARSRACESRRSSRGEGSAARVEGSGVTHP